MDGTARNRCWIALFLLGISSGLPMVLSGDLLAAWLTGAGYNAEKIGLVGLVGLPYAFKVLWAPLADRFSPRFLGRRRGWMFGSQLFLIAAVFALSLADPQHSFLLLAAAALAVAFFSATLDIVYGAWMADILPPALRGPGAAVSVCGYRTGLILAGSGGLLLAGHFHVPWPVVCRAVGAAMTLGLAGAIIAVEPEARHTPTTLRQAVMEPLAAFLGRPSGLLILLFVLVFKLPEYACNAMSLPYMIHLGISLDRIAEIRQGAGVALSILGTILGGLVVRQIGIWRSLWLFAFLHSVSNLGFLLLAKSGPNSRALVTAIVIENTCSGLTMAGFVAWMIGQCDPRYSAFQFSLLSGVMALGRVLATPLAGWMALHLGWQAFFVASAALGIPSIFLLPWVYGEDDGLAGSDLKTWSTVVVNVSSELAET